MNESAHDKLEAEELIERVKSALGLSTQAELAEKLSVSPSTISNWLSLREIPKSKRPRLLALLQEKQGQPVTSASQQVVVPDTLKQDETRCGYWGKSAWSFHYIGEPAATTSKAVTDDIYRLWIGVSASRHTTFRHHTRYHPIDPGRTRDKDPLPIGTNYGFLEKGQKEEWTTPSLSGGTQRYMSIFADLDRGEHGFGAYSVRAPDSVFRASNENSDYEFVTFKPECPVQAAHVVLSIPKSLRGAGPSVGYRVALEYSQLYDVASRIKSDTGELELMIEPWGGLFTVTRFRPDLFDELVGCPSELAHILKSHFTSNDERDVYIVTDPAPIPLTTLMLLWPLPKKT